MPLFSFINGQKNRCIQPAENSHWVDLYMLKFFMVRPASVSLNPYDLCPLEDLQSTRPVVSPHLSIHTCAICIRHAQMWKIFWELQISQYDITESLNTPRSVVFGVRSSCQIATGAAATHLFRSRFFSHTY